MIGVKTVFLRLRSVVFAYAACIVTIVACNGEVDDSQSGATAKNSQALVAFQFGEADGGTGDTEDMDTGTGDGTDDASAPPIYLNPFYSPEERAADLVSRMSLVEKASQLNSSQSPAISRLGVAAYGWWNEAAHGVAREQTVSGANSVTLINTTSYPVSLSLGATWDPALVYQEAVQISDEVREVFRDNTLDLNVYSPTVNLGRDPRWGRNDETFSEDPFLTTVLASQFINGMEGNDPFGMPLFEGRGYLKVSSTLKHYAANNSEFNRRTGSSDMDDRTLREYYTAQFRDIIETSRPSSIMSAYNAVNGTPNTADVDLIDTLARETFGFRGFITSDCDSIREMQASLHWQPPGYTEPVDRYERHAFALTAGVDLNCHQGYSDAYNYGNTLPEAVGMNIETFTGTLNENDIDVAAVRLFTTRIRLGEFDDPAEVPWVTKARDRVPAGTWVNSDDNNAVTQTPERLEIARRTAAQSIVLLKNNDTTRKDGTTGKLLPLEVPSSGPFSVAVIGYFADLLPMYLGGYSSNQGAAGLANEVTGFSGIKTAIQAANPEAVVDYYRGFTFGVAVIDPAAVEASANYDAVVVYVGNDARDAREDIDRTTLSLRGAQASLISQIAAVNPNTIVYMETIGAVDVSSFEPEVAAMLWSSFNGMRKGEALADVLLGAVNPGGRLPFTWYGDIAQLPAIGDYSIRPTDTTMGRTYMYFNGDVAYPFGYGLSYTDFAISPPWVSKRHVDANGFIHVAASVTNTGDVPGAEVVQLYVTTPEALSSLERPIKRLRGFQKVYLMPNETKPVYFVIEVPDLAFFDESLGAKVVDTGVYGIQLSTSASDQDIKQQATVSVVGRLRPKVSVVTAKPVVLGDADAGITRRVIFPMNAEIDPQLTISLSDDTLYGYITKDAGKSLPLGMRVHYWSNRPWIVSADPWGKIRTGTMSGIATVTAWVEYLGSYAATSFVVQVGSRSFF